MATKVLPVIAFIRKEIKKLKADLAKRCTKEEFEKYEAKSRAFRTVVDNKLQNCVSQEQFSNAIKEIFAFMQQNNNDLRGEMQEMKKELKDKILQFKDDILTEVIKIREDIAVVTGYRDMIENHEVRIDKLEKKTSIN